MDETVRFSPVEAKEQSFGEGSGHRGFMSSLLFLRDSDVIGDSEEERELDRVLNSPAYKVILCSPSDGKQLRQAGGLSELLARIRTVASSALSEQSKKSLLLCEGRVLVLAGFDSIEGADELAYALIDKLRDEFRRQGLAISVNTGVICTSFQELGMSFRQAEDEEEYNRFTQQPHHTRDLTGYEEWQMFEKEQRLLNDSAEKLYTAICAMDRSAMVRQLEDSLDVLVDFYPFRISDLHRRVRCFADELLQRLARDDLLVLDEKRRDSVMMALVNAPSERELRRLARTYCGRILELNPEGMRSSTPWKLARVRNYIDEHYSDPALDASSLSRGFGLNASRLSQQFRARYGISVLDYIHSLRIDRAVALLMNTELPLAEISRLCGYGTLGTMHRSFRKYLDTSPGEFRNGGEPR